MDSKQGTSQKIAVLGGRSELNPNARMGNKIKKNGGVYFKNETNAVKSIVDCGEIYGREPCLSKFVSCVLLCLCVFHSYFNI